MEQEIWKQIKNYEGLYEVSSLGRVKSMVKVKSGKRPSRGFYCGKERIMNPGDNGKGYLFVNLSKNKKSNRYYVHRLVAENFIKNDERKRCVNHKDCDKSNNKLSNLEWVTEYENSIHSYNAGRLSHLAEARKKIDFTNKIIFGGKLKNADIMEIFKLREKNKTHKEIATLFNVSRSAIGYVLNKKTYKNVSC